MTSPPRFDPGLQLERTVLAWRRTALSLVLGSLVSLRILPPALGPWSLVPGFAGLALSVLLWMSATRRSARTSVALYAGKPLPDGRLVLQVAITVSLAGALGLLYVLR